MNEYNDVPTEKIKIGTKGKDNGIMFYPYIPVFELLLPLKFIGWDKNNQPVFKKIKQNENI